MSFLTDFITMTIVINPFSKMLISSMMAKKIKKLKDVRDIINFSNLIALLLILFFALLGPLIFNDLLGVSDTALILACGISLGIFGINYLFRDEIFRIEEKSKSVMYLSIGTPLIAGPASISTITIISSYSSIGYSFLIGFLAISVNYVLMLFAQRFAPVTKENEKLQYLTTRLTGLFMLAVGIQFVLTALKNWLIF